jgi:hypothetical protein
MRLWRVHPIMLTMTPHPPRSRLLLMPETLPAGPRGERPKVRRYRLVRLPGSALPSQHAHQRSRAIAELAEELAHIR